MRGQLGNLMQQAQKMQENLKRAQEELAQLEVTGQAGAGMVKVTLNGKMAVRRVQIDKAAVGDDVEMLEDLITTAFARSVGIVALDINITPNTDGLPGIAHVRLDQSTPWPEALQVRLP